MEYTYPVKVATIVLCNFFAITVHIVAFVVIYMKANRNASAKSFFLVQISMIIWLVGKVFKTVSPTADLRWAFIVFYYFGICLLGASFLNFSYTYYSGEKLRKKIKIPIYIVAFMEFLLVLTNPYHYMFYSVYGFWGDEFGELFYIYIIINYTFIIVGMILCYKKFKVQAKNRGKLGKNIISIAILLPIICNFLYITRWLESQFIKVGIGMMIFDTTPIAYTWSLLIFVYATFKYEFFSLTPIMKHEITSRLDTPILILNSTGQVLYANKQLENNFDSSSGYQYLIKKNLHIKKEEKNSIIDYSGEFYKYHVSELKNAIGKKYIITFNNITSYQYAKQELDKENRQLDNANIMLEEQISELKQISRIGARNYIAREFHDIIGHSLVVTIKLLEVSKMFYKNDRKRTYESLEKASFSINNGFEEMKGITSKNSEIKYSSYFLDRELKSMLKVVEVSGIQVNFYFRGTLNKMDEKIYDIIKKVSTELVTNTLKHANATKILLSITIKENEILVQLMDNGIGVENLKKGNGLTGIEDRLSLVGGNAKFITNKSEGFTSNITIPL